MPIQPSKSLCPIIVILTLAANTYQVLATSFISVPRRSPTEVHFHMPRPENEGLEVQTG